MTHLLTFFSMIPPKLCAMKMIGLYSIASDKYKVVSRLLRCTNLQVSAPQLRQFHHKSLGMSVDILSRRLRKTTRIGVVSIGQDPRIRDVVRQEMSQPHRPIFCGPRSFSMTIEAMDCNDAVLWRQDGHNLFRSSHTRRLGCCPALIRESPSPSVLIPSGERSLSVLFCYRVDRSQGIGEVVAVINERV
jgi:hypothetical protein